MNNYPDISNVLQRACDEGKVAGVVVALGSSSDELLTAAFGKRGADSETEMTPDSVFWIASMTKAITTVAAMQLVEQEKLSLDGNLNHLIPELANAKVLEGFDENGEPRLRAPRSHVTLRQLLTHSAGFGYDFWNKDLLNYKQKLGLPASGSGARAALQLPLTFDPGTQWQYGINTDITGLLVEAASGQRLDAFLRDNILAPLGMNDTGFALSPSQRNRRAGMHKRNADGSLTPIPFETAVDPEVYYGGAALYSTAPDYLRFTRMLLNGGTGNGNRILSADTVKLMSQNHIGDLQMTQMPSYVPGATNDVDLLPGIDKKWGLGFMINQAQTPEGRSAGSLAWAGLANSYYWIDPVRDISGVILMQVLPFADKTCLGVFADFERAAYASLKG